MPWPPDGGARSVANEQSSEWPACSSAVPRSKRRHPPFDGKGPLLANKSYVVL